MGKFFKAIGGFVVGELVVLGICEVCDRVKKEMKKRNKKRMAKEEAEYQEKQKQI